MSSRSPSPRQMLPVLHPQHQQQQSQAAHHPPHHHHQQHHQQQQQYQRHQQQLHLIPPPSHYRYQKMTPTEADSSQGYTFYPAARMDAAAVAYGNHIAAGQPCATAHGGVATLAPASIQVASIVEPTTVLAPTPPQQQQQQSMAQPQRHARHRERYSPYGGGGGGAQQQQQRVAAAGPAHTHAGLTYEQQPQHHLAAAAGGGGGGMQVTPTSPQQLQASMETVGGAHFAGQEEHAMKQQHHQQQQAAAIDYAHYSGSGGGGQYKGRRHSEMAHTPDGMEHAGPLYGDIGVAGGNGAAQSSAAGGASTAGDRASAFMTPPPPSSGVTIASAPRSLHLPSHYQQDEGKASSVATTPLHQYAMPRSHPHLDAYEGTGAGGGDGNSLWQPSRSMVDAMHQHGQPAASQTEYGPRSRHKPHSGDTLPSPSTSSQDADECEGSSVPRYLPTRGQKLKPGDEFTTVPGRLSLLGSASKYIVTIGEVQRRLAPPECLNASLLGGVLRKAKARNGGTDLRRALEDIGLHLPPGRRKAAGTSMLTSLVEEEARCLASQFNGICRKMFPTAELATTVCRQQAAAAVAHSGSQHIEERQHAIKNAIQLTNELGEQLQAYLEQEEADRDNENVNLPGLRQFSLITHSFGVLVVHGVMQVFQGYLNNLLKTTSGMVIRDHALQHQPPASMQQQQQQQQQHIPPHDTNPGVHKHRRP